MLYNAGRDAERRVREIVQTAFGKDIALDFTSLRRILLRIGENFTDLPDDPRDARAVLESSLSLDDQGDGFRSFVGIVISLAAVQRGLFLIDEPEVFLHPPHAFRIGEFLANQANDRRQSIVATHSADVLRGILSKTHNVSIARLHRDGDQTIVTKLDAEGIEELVVNPLLSSARVLDGLFYSGVVVVEGDRDARFYSAVSKRMQDRLDLHFVNADNEQTVPHICSIYRAMGIRCVGLVDFDVLNHAIECAAQIQGLSRRVSARTSDLFSRRHRKACGISRAF